MEKYRNRHNFRRIWLKRYYGMNRRVNGVKVDRNHSSRGKELLSKEDFLNWCSDKENLAIFKKLHREYIESDYSLSKSLTIDRIDNSVGYTVDNIQWLPFEENIRKGRREYTN